MLLEISLTEQQTAQQCHIQNPKEIITFRLISYRWINIIMFLVTICLCIQQCSHSIFYYFDPLRCLAFFNTVLYPIWHISKKLHISCNSVYYSLQRVPQTGSSHNRKTSGRPQCTNEWKDKCIWVSGLRNRCLTGSHLADPLNGTRRTRVSPSTVHRRLQDAGLKDWVKRESYSWDWLIKWKD